MLTSIERFADHVRVTWSDDSTATFHHLWLRDNCQCQDCRHHTVPERLVDTVSIPDDVAPSKVDVDGDALVVEWTDAHRSEFSGRWLADHVYDCGPRWPTDRRELWPAHGDVPAPEAAFDEVIGSDSALLGWLQDIERVGVTLVRDAPTVEGTVRRLAERVAFLRNSNFGEVWDVVSKPDPDSIAYTAHRLTPHTDLVGREMLPGVQFLHCLVFDASGGDTVLVDGFACAAELAATDPSSYELLTTTPLLFRYRDGTTTDLATRAPMIGLDATGRVREVRVSNALLAPLDVPADRMITTYRAVRAFGRLVRSGRYERCLRLRPGDVMCFDNYRILHGRGEFDPNSGARHLQGCYVDRDDFLSRLRTLEARASRPAPEAIPA